MLVRETHCSDQLCKIPYNYVYGIVIALFTDNNVAKKIFSNVIHAFSIKLYTLHNINLNSSPNDGALTLNIEHL